MSGFIGDLLEGIASFVSDIWLLRRRRAGRSRPKNAVGKDAADVALFDIRVIGLSILTLAVTALMFFVLGLPLWTSLLPVAAGALYVGYRWIALARA